LRQNLLPDVNRQTIAR